MNEMLRRALIDWFDPGDFAECIGVTVEDLIYAFPDEVDDCLDELREIIGYPLEDNDNDE